MDIFDIAYLQRVGEQMEAAQAEYESGVRPLAPNVAYQTSLFSGADCQRLMSELRGQHWHTGLVGVAGIGAVDTGRYSALETFFDPSEDRFKWVMDQLWPCICAAGVKLGLNGLRLAEQARIVRYRAGDHFNWHKDSDATAPRRLTVSVQLSEPDSYAGGGLIVLGDSGEWHFAANDLGAACLFPAERLHRVAPVESGERLALVCWCY
ncbi:2OG-Fe(II) oxygenase [Microbulbifer sp. ARAS458-1]|uniref:2OG-Fe(II) oxygenase n=1 Tax=Microbulbifer sp. ARAS458-1 TaxID=3140242 RepID=UPI003878105C